MLPSTIGQVGLGEGVGPVVRTGGHGRAAIGLGRERWNELLPGRLLIIAVVGHRLLGLWGLSGLRGISCNIICAIPIATPTTVAFGEYVTPIDRYSSRRCYPDCRSPSC